MYFVAQLGYFAYFVVPLRVFCIPLCSLPLRKRGNLKQCQNYRTISLISHASKMLRVIPSRLKAKAEELLAQEQTGIRPGRSTVEQLFNSRVIIEKHLQNQRDLYHNFVDFKKAFDRVWHAGLWQVFRSFNIEEGLVQAIQHCMRTPMQSS